MTKAQEYELLAVLWNIMCTMVDIEFGMDSVQMVLPTLIKKADQDQLNMLEQEETQKQFNK